MSMIVPYTSSLTSKHWFPKLVAVVRSPITGLNGNLQGSVKFPDTGSLDPPRAYCNLGRKEEEGWMVKMEVRGARTLGRV